MDVQGYPAMGGSRDCLDSILVPNGGSRSNTQFLEAGMTEKGAWCCGVGVEPAASVPSGRRGVLLRGLGNSSWLCSHHTWFSDALGDSMSSSVIFFFF